MADFATSIKLMSLPVFVEVIENDFERLIGLLTIDSTALSLMVEMSARMERGNSDQETENLEEQKEQAIAKCRRRIEAARRIFEAQGAKRA